jgi:hypothetical protein
MNPRKGGRPPKDNMLIKIRIINNLLFLILCNWLRKVKLIKLKNINKFIEIKE